MSEYTQPGMEPLLAEISLCHACAGLGTPAHIAPIVRHCDRIAQIPASFVVVGQAPSLTDLRAGRTYQGPAGQKLVSWLLDAGFAEEDIGTRVYMTALTKCFPGRLPGKSTDRAPSPAERSACRSWLDRELAILRPRVIVPFGKMAIDTFLRPVAPLGEQIGQRFNGPDGVAIIPLPHSSGASTWLNMLENRALLERAIGLIREERANL